MLDCQACCGLLFINEQFFIQEVLFEASISLLFPEVSITLPSSRSDENFILEIAHEQAPNQHGAKKEIGKQSKPRLEAPMLLFFLPGPCSACFIG